MPSWKDILDEVKASGSTYDVVRRKYLAKLFEITGRNTIVYYSGWLQKGYLIRRGLDPTMFYINDSDKNGFMAAINKLDRSRGLDLILHTPGGSTAATESLVDYLHAMFGIDIRVIIPQLAMSAGTMLACASKEILMGKHSSLGPIDPQISGVAAHGIIEEFNRAAREIRGNQTMIPLWQPIIAKYTPTLIGECERSIAWSEEIVKEWLITGMFKDETDRQTKADRIISEMGSHALTKSHDRHISMKRAKEFGLKITALEDNQELQDAVLTVHHACIQTLSDTPAYKIIENHIGVAYIDTLSAAIITQ